ncbi:hypothetical protein HanRHA438_Chr11g0495001 [Helianthus annuus]|nr:hypothetical protein HanRHA438_Chr11g0495001 [Helianthus annuus]
MQDRRNRLIQVGPVLGVRFVFRMNCSILNFHLHIHVFIFHRVVACIRVNICWNLIFMIFTDVFQKSGFWVVNFARTCAL